MAFDQDLVTLQESIDRDEFLRDANFESHIVMKSLAYHKHNVDATLKTLTNCAKWHKEVLGHQSKRVSIVHIHAFLLTESFTFLPTATDRNGRPIILFRGSKETRSIPSQHLANFVMWFHFWAMRSNDNNKYNFLLSLEGFKLKQFRPSQLKRLDEANTCQTIQSADATVYVFNANRFVIKIWNTVLRVAKSAVFSKTHFIKPAELSTFMDVSNIPVDFGGLRSLEDTRADMEDFIREEYAREGLRYESIDIKTLNWKTYKVPDMDLTLRPDSVMSIASNVDFDQIDAQLEKMGLNDDSEE
ncbi:hypothetical protein BDR26DRAFT_857863 [Obelidium mucronatum]|nr:hypothetical protein BDR26DRAFT_857863 [Obelidium mucronatum]